MPRIRIDKDELYPYFPETTCGGREIEVTEQELKLIRKADKLFNKAQDLLIKKYDELTR